MAHAWKFFPVVGKAPALPGDWRSHSTANEAVLEGWLNRGWGLALDCGASGVTVIDPDADKVTREPVGDRELAALGALPDTYEVHTPGGGRHLYFDDPEGVRGRDLADHVNVRSIGGYVVFDDGREGYRLVKDMPLAPLPAWVRERVAEIAATRAKVEAEIELDLPANIRRAAQMLDSLAPAVEGAGGDNWTLQVIQKVLDIAPLSPDAMLDVLCEWNERCDPPWEDDELRTKIENALAYRQNDLGAWAVAPPAERFGAVLDRLGVTDQAGGAAPKKPLLAVWASPAAQDSWPKPEWAIPNLVGKGKICVMWARQHSLKSFIADSAGFSAGSTIDGGWGLGEHKPQLVGIVSEDPEGTKLRRQAWERAHGVPTTTFVWDREADWRPSASDPRSIDKFISLSQGTDLLIIDPWIMFLGGLDESKPADQQVASEQLHRICNGVGCAIIMVAHAAKDGKSIRGTEVLLGSAHHEFVVERLGLEENKPTLTAALHNRHHKNAPLSGTTWWRGQPAAESLAFRKIPESEVHEAQKSQVSLVAVLDVLGSSTIAWPVEALAAEMTRASGLVGQGLVDATLEATKALREMAKNPALRELVTGSGATLKFRWPR